MSGEDVKTWHVYITSRGPSGPIGDCVETTEALARLAGQVVPLPDIPGWVNERSGHVIP